MVTAASTPPQRKREDTGTDRSQDVSWYSFWTGFLIGVLVSIVLLDVVSRAPLGEPRGLIGDRDNSYIRSPGNGYIVAPDRATVSKVKDDSSLCDESLGAMTLEEAPANVDASAEDPRVRVVTGDKEFDEILHEIRTASASGSQYVNYRYDADDCTAMQDVECTPHIRRQKVQLYVDSLQTLGFKVLLGKIANMYFMEIGWGTYVQTDYASAVLLLTEKTAFSANQ